MVAKNIFTIQVELSVLLLSLLILSTQLRTTACAKGEDNRIDEGDDGQIEIRMPDIRPDHGEQYLCMSHRVGQDTGGDFIVGFHPKSDAHRVHHMLLYGCQMPGIFQRDSPNFVWDCSSMHSSSLGGGVPIESSFEEGPVCHGQTEILYGWAMDAPALKLPQGVGFKIGGLDSGINFLVLQVHYGHYHAFEHSPDLTDNSGLLLDIKADSGSSGISKRAGVLLMSSIGKVPIGHSKHEIWCTIDDEIEIHPFRYRVHTHKMGTKVMGAKISGGHRSSRGFKVDQAELIGVGDPQEAQMFYPVQENITLRRGDKVYSSCEFSNNKSHEVSIGQTGDDEMCNFYLMYWTESPRLLRESNCMSQNPPSLLDSWIGALLE